MENFEVFISYSWKEESNTIVTEIEQLLKAKKINVIRDKSNLNYKGLIKEFMNGLGKGKFIILILSEDYLKSENCMYELLQISKDDFYNRIFPLVLPGTNIYKATDRIKYVHYWENEINELEKSIKVGSLTYLQGIFSDLDLYSEIRRNIDKITTVLKNINVLSIPLQQINNYQPLIEKLQSQIEIDFNNQVLTKTEHLIIDYFELFLNKKLENSQKKLINDILSKISQTEFYERNKLIENINLVTHNLKKAREIFDFYTQCNNFKNYEKLFRSYTYLSLNKLVRTFNINKQSISTLYSNSINDAQSNEEKLCLLYQFYKEKGLITFLNGELYVNDKVPVNDEPVVYFEGTYQLADTLTDHFSNLKFENNSNNKISIGTAHYILEYPDPLVYPIIQLKADLCGNSFEIAISRKYIPFTSGNTHQLTAMLSGDTFEIKGFGSIEYINSNHYHIQPIVLSHYF